MYPAAGTHLFVVVASALFGLMIGSFLNVVVYRVPRHMSIVRPASHCPACGTELKLTDNVPLISWLWLRGRCRYCRVAISARYPLVELATGLAFVAIAIAAGSVLPLPSLFLMTGATIAAAAIDADGLPVPPPVVMAAALGSATLVLVAVAITQPARIGWAGAGAAVAGVAAFVADRSLRRTGRAEVLAAVGWSAGWLWPSGGFVLAGWVTLIAIVTTRHDRTGADAARTFTLALEVAGGYALVLAGAALTRLG